MVKGMVRKKVSKVVERTFKSVIKRKKRKEKKHRERKDQESTFK